MEPDQEIHTQTINLPEKPSKSKEDLKNQTESTPTEKEEENCTEDHSIEEAELRDHYSFTSYKPMVSNLEKHFKPFALKLPKTDPYALYHPTPYNCYFEKHYFLEDKKKTSIYEAIPPQNHNEINIICFHGASGSALSFCQLTKELKNYGYRVFAYDLYGHGETETNENENEGEPNLSMDLLINQAEEVFELIKEQRCSESSNERFCFVGHSLGGAIAAKLADKILNQSEYSCHQTLISIVLIDCIEGTAMFRAKEMEELYMQFPKSFFCLESAISWTIRSHLLKRIESAKASVSHQLKKKLKETESLGLNEQEEELEELEQQSLQPQPQNNKTTPTPTPITKQNFHYVWKVNILKTVKYWQDWFKGLSNIMITIPLSPLLLTLNKERLDYTLAFELFNKNINAQNLSVEYFDYSGHYIHEDEYEKCAKVIDEHIKKVLKLKVDESEMNG